ncbi:hypothetical protein GALL_546050 [mine drainage metagenome]|uniref:Uncharacterized protein n=1 Tax=mine drainage metagenome TaxID=410659 RepID=A0A1J5PF20_9ZZZZ
MCPDHRPLRQIDWKSSQGIDVAGACHVAVHRPVGRCTAGPAVEVHQQKRQVVSYVDGRQLFVELQRVERHRAALPQADVSQMQVAMAAAHETVPVPR